MKNICLWALIAALASACGSPQSEESKNYFVRGTLSSFDHRLPQTSQRTEDEALFRDIFSTLVELDTGKQVVPGCAHSWKSDENAQRHEIEISESCKWSDGTRVVANDFLRTFELILSPGSTSPHKSKLAQLRAAAQFSAGEVEFEKVGAKAASTYVLELELNAPSTMFLKLLAHQSLAPLPPPQSNSENKKQLSNGPYRIATFNPGRNVVLERNPYFQDDKAGTADFVEYRYYESELAMYNAFRSGQLDFVDSLPQGVNDDVREDPNQQLLSAERLEVFTLVVNLQSDTFIENPKLLRRLSESIDREIIVENVTKSGQLPAYSIVPPVFGGYETSDIRELPATESVDGKAAPSFPLRLIVNNNESVLRIVSAITAMWKEELGTVTTVDANEMRVFLDKLQNSNDWELARVSWNADYPDPLAFLELFSTEAGYNFGDYNDPVFDQLLVKAADTANEKHRLALLSEAENRMLAGRAVIPVYFAAGSFAMRSSYKWVPTTDKRLTRSIDIFK